MTVLRTLIRGFQPRDVPIPLAVTGIVCLLAVSCVARVNPDVEALRTTYLRASVDPSLRANGAAELAAMDLTVRRAEELAARGGDQREIDHLVYMARRQLELGQAKAAYAQARTEIEQSGTSARYVEPPRTYQRGVQYSGTYPSTSVREVNEGVRPTHEVDRVVSITQHSSPDGTVSGQVTNRSASAIRNVEMMIRYEWFWANEMNPGDYSPGRTERFELADRIAPGQTASFTYTPTVPLPRRNDGHFEVSIRPVGFVELPN